MDLAAAKRSYETMLGTLALGARPISWATKSSTEVWTLSGLPAAQSGKQQRRGLAGTGFGQQRWHSTPDRSEEAQLLEGRHSAAPLARDRLLKR